MYRGHHSTQDGVEFQGIPPYTLPEDEAALELAGITGETVDPPGGRIVRDESGSPTGLLIDRAMGLVSSVIPELDRATKLLALREAVNHCVSVGLTTVHDAGVGADVIELYKELIDKDRFNFRVYAMLSAGRFAASRDASDFLKEKPDPPPNWNCCCELR